MSSAHPRNWISSCAPYATRRRVERRSFSFKWALRGYYTQCSAPFDCASFIYAPAEALVELPAGVS